MPCRNEAKHLPIFLDSLSRQDLSGLEAEFLIADGHSDDGSREILESYSAKDPRIRVVDNPGKIVSTGLNAAIRAARGQYVLRMDAHSQFAPDYVRACIRVIQETGADNVGGAARTRAVGWLARAIAAAYHSPFSTGGAKFHRVGYEGPVDTVTYGCWRREIFDRLGFLDETLVRNQDDEFNLRTVRAGGIIWQSKQIVSWYHPRGRLSHLSRQYFQYGYWKVAVIRKHRIPASWRHLVPGSFFLVLAVLLLLATGFAAVGSWAFARLTTTILTVILASYVTTSLVFSWKAASRDGQDLLPILPIVFATYHAAYGLGFLSGILHSPRSHGLREGRFSGLSR